MQAFRVISLDHTRFAHLFECSDAQLQALGVKRLVASCSPGYPCRVSLVDAQVGEEVLLLHYEHHAVPSPYRAAGPIYVRRGAVQAQPAAGELPEYLTTRLLSVRAYDEQHLMVRANVVEGAELADEIQRCLQHPEVSYLQLHNAKPGCYSCAVVRA